VKRHILSAPLVGVLCLHGFFWGMLQASPQKLVQEMNLPLVFEGKTVGSMKLPAGSEVEVVSNDGTNAVIKRGDSVYTIPPSSLPAASSSAVAAASPSATSSPTPLQASAPTPLQASAPTPFQASAPIDKTLNDSTLAPFFIPNGEHSLSDIDASRLKDDLPGAHGWLTVKNGHLYNGDKKLRIVGVNGKGSDDDLLEMKKYGFNAVRLCAWGTIVEPYSKHPRKLLEGNTINPERLQELDQVVGKFVNAGFWVDLNINSPGPAEVDDNERENFKMFLTALLNHVNPYTGKTYGNDAAIFSMEIANEFGARQRLVYPNDCNSGKFNPRPYTKSIEEKWNKWLCDHYKTQSELEAAWAGTTDKLGSVIWRGDETTLSFHIQEEGKDWFKFTDDLEIDYTKDIMSFLHDQLHYQGLVIAGCDQIKNEVTKFGDATMTHMYPDGNRGTKTTRIDVNRGKDRIFGKPFLVTECNLDALDSHYGEVALSSLSAATAQDWDGVFLFSWAGNWNKVFHGTIEGPENMIKGNAVKDNAVLLSSLPTAINLFRRGDIASLTGKKRGDYTNYFDQQIGRWGGENDKNPLEEKPFGDTGTYSLNDKSLNIVSGLGIWSQCEG
jgi:hypothetical protein